MSDHGRLLGDGLVLRQATPDDLEAVVRLGVEAHGADEEWGIRTVFADPDVGPLRTTVVTDRDRVVSTVCLMAHTFRFGPVDVAVGRPEYVATAPGYRRRGLIRAQFDLLHEWSHERGDLVQVIGGIPYFYRQFGYAYGVVHVEWHRPTAAAPAAMPAGWAVREAGVDDLDVLRRLRADALRGSDISVVRTDREWEVLLRGDDTRPVRVSVAEEGGQVRGSALVRTEGQYLLVADIAVDRVDAVTALVADARARAAASVLYVADRPGTGASSWLADHGEAARPPSLLYARVPDAVALLHQLEPVLSARLAESPLGAERGEVVISLYRRSIRLAYEGGKIVGVEDADGIEDPEDAGVAGLPPELLPALVFGRFGARGLEERHDDVHLGRQRALLSVLFPRLRPDVLLAAP